MLKTSDISYGFGQMGSAYTGEASVIVPPANHVIVAIQFLKDNTPTIMRTEKSDREGPGFPGITGTTNKTVGGGPQENWFNFNGAWASPIIGDATYTAGTEITLGNPPSWQAGDPPKRIRVGQYVILVNDTAAEDGSPTMLPDESGDGVPVPIYNGSNSMGCRVTEFTPANKIKLSMDIVSTDKSLVFLDEFHGAGGHTVEGQLFPKGMTIYGRWTMFKPSAGGVICYFGK